MINEALIEAVAKIDKGAAEYLREHGQWYRPVVETVSAALCWLDSPQGHGFWNNIHNQVGRVKPKVDPKKYRLLKPVSIKALEEAGACGRELHRFAFLLMKESGPGSWGYDSELPNKVVARVAAQCKDGIPWLIREGFIEEVVERPDLKVDDPVLVRDYDGGAWEKMYFARWCSDEKGDPLSFPIRTWDDGSTSWSNDSGTTGWKQWKLPEDA